MMKRDQILVALAAVVRCLGLEGCYLGQAHGCEGERKGMGGSLLILAASFGIGTLPDECRRQILQALVGCERDDLINRPQAQWDPIGYCLIENCWREPGEIFDRLIDARTEREIEQVLCDRAAWNPVFKATIEETLDIVRKTCLENDFFESEGSHKTAIERRVLHQRYHLKAHSFACGENLEDKSFIALRAAALNCLECVHPGTKERISKEWISSLVPKPDKRSRTRGEDMVVPISSVAPVLHPTAATNMRQFDHAEEQPMKKGVGRPRIECLSGVAIYGGVGRVTLDLIQRRCLERVEFDQGAVLTAGMIFAALDPEKLDANCQFREVEGGFLLGTPMIHPVKGGLVDHRFVHPVSPVFWRMVPTKIGRALLSLRNAKTLAAAQRRVAVDDFVKSCHPAATFVRLRSTLLYNGPIWFGLTEIFYHFGLNWNATGETGWRSYVTWVPTHGQQQLTAFLRRIDPLFPDSNPELEGLPACGSPFTPRSEVVIELMAQFERMCESLPDEEGQWVSHVNAAAALADFFFALFTFTRRIDAGRPPILFINSSGDPIVDQGLTIINEKGYPRVIFVSQAAVKVLTTVRKLINKFEKAVAEKGWRLCADDLTPYAFYQFRVEERNEPTSLRRVIVTKEAARKALKACSETAHFLFPWQMMRDFGSWVLRDVGEFIDPEIHQLLDHFDVRARSPLHSHSDQCPVPRALVERAAATIYEYLHRH